MEQFLPLMLRPTLTGSQKKSTGLHKNTTTSVRTTYLNDGSGLGSQVATFTNAHTAAGKILSAQSSLTPSDWKRRPDPAKSLPMRPHLPPFPPGSGHVTALNKK